MRRTGAMVLFLLLAAGCGSPTINVVDPFAVVNWSPHDGATCIDPEWAGLTFSVCMTREVQVSSAQVHVSLREILADGSLSDAIAASSDRSERDPACVEIREATLKPATDYAIVLSALLEAADGTLLGHQLTSRFRTIDDGC